VIGEPLRHRRRLPRQPEADPQRVFRLHAGLGRHAADLSRRQRRPVRLPRAVAALLSSPAHYFTAMVTPGWLRRDVAALPIETVSGIAGPARTVGGTIALICTRPATAPGDVPA